MFLMSDKKIYQPEVEHLFDAHYRASRPRRRIIRVCGGVRGAGAVGDLARGLYSSLLRPATSMSLYSFPPISDEVCPSRFSRLYIFSSLFLLLISASPFLSTLSSTNYLRRWRSSSSEFALQIATSPVLCIRCALLSSYPSLFLFEIREGFYIVILI